MTTNEPTTFNTLLGRIIHLAQLHGSDLPEEELCLSDEIDSASLNLYEKNYLDGFLCCLIRKAARTLKTSYELAEDFEHRFEMHKYLNHLIASWEGDPDNEVFSDVPPSIEGIIEGMKESGFMHMEEQAFLTGFATALNMGDLTKAREPEPHSNIPGTTQDMIRAYIKHHVPASGFLKRVLCNDLAGAVAKADLANARALVNIVDYLRDNAPPDCWGSVEAYVEWLDT